MQHSFLRSFQIFGNLSDTKEHCVLLRSFLTLKKTKNVFFFEFFATYETKKNVAIFLKECASFKKNARSFEKNAHSLKRMRVLLKRMRVLLKRMRVLLKERTFFEKNARSFKKKHAQPWMHTAELDSAV